METVVLLLLEIIVLGMEANAENFTSALKTKLDNN